MQRERWRKITRMRTKYGTEKAGGTINHSMTSDTEETSGQAGQVEEYSCEKLLLLLFGQWKGG
jgi:hypothetical protein